MNLEQQRFQNHLMNAKEEKFREIVKDTALNLGVEVPEVQFIEGYCPFDTGNEIAHIHLDSGIICVSRLRLVNMTVEDIYETATHEVSHLIEMSHNAKFDKTNSEAKRVIWKLKYNYVG